MNRMSIIVGWVALTFIAIGVSSAAVGSVGDRVSPQPASVLEAAGDIVALGSGGDAPDTTRAGSVPSSTIIDPEDAATAAPVSTTTTDGSTPSTTSGSTASTTEPPAPTTTTTTGPGDTTTTTVQDGTTTSTTVDGSSTTTTTTVATVPPTTTSTTFPPTTTTTTTTPPDDEIDRRTIDSKGGWIRISWTDHWLRLGAAGPRVGFKLEVLENDGERIVVRFLSRDHISRIVVVLDDGDAKVEVTERERDG